MDYKDSLNLPRTGFSMKADLVAREPQRLDRWLQSGLYQRMQRRRVDAPKFILHDGPPFANGDVHVGTAGNKIRKDFIIKYLTLQGRQAPYVPGWDCHGLPIEFKVVQEMRKHGQTALGDPVAIRQACEAYARKFIDLQRRQFQRTGVLGDWDNPYLTLSPQYEADELCMFADLVEQGYVYRGKKPVYWSIPCRTALAEAEVEYQDHVSQSIYVKFPVIGRPGTYVLIWTTTPWTLPANLAIAYNSTFNYTLVNVGDDSFIVSVSLLNQLAEKCGWGGFQIIRSLDKDHLGQITCQHPFVNRTVRLLAGDSFVDNTTGTGFVHIAPGHGLEDYQLGLQNGLPIYSPVDDNGCLCQTADLPVEQQIGPDLVGLPILEKQGRSEANEGVMRILRDRGMLVHAEDYTHSYPHCWRSKTPVIFRAMDQWFIRIDHKNLRDRALDAIGQIQWVPAWGQSRIEAAVKARPDWCISRQRVWGVPIPVFYDTDGNPILDARIIRAAAGLVRQHGSNIWFEKTSGELWSMLKPAGWSGPEAASKATDTLDVWIDSGSSSRAVTMRRPELQSAASAQDATMPACRADMYFEGSDQHRGWFQSSLLLSLAGNDSPPYQTVLTHGFMVDAEREKISKSKQGQGGYQKPQTSDAYIKRYGADVLRLWIASQDFRNDVVVSEERINKVGEAYRGIRNALRYQLSNLFDFDPSRHARPFAQLTALDRWILARFSQLQKEVAAAYDAYEFHVVYQKISQFVAVELSAIYHDIVKDRLYTEPPDSDRRRSTQTALHLIASCLCQMLAPILVFTADEAWEFLPGAKTDESVHASDWHDLGFEASPDELRVWQKLLSLREQALVKLEEARQSKLIGKSTEARLSIAAPADEMPADPIEQEVLREMINVSQLDITRREGPLEFMVAHASGQKCERCWRWETDVGIDAHHPTLCGRCVGAVVRDKALRT